MLTMFEHSFRNFKFNHLWISPNFLRDKFTRAINQEIKNANGFWKKGQAIPLNSLQTITAGNGYLVKMNAAGTLSVVGIPVETRLIASQNAGWNLTGCSFQTSTAFSTVYNATNCDIIKDFEGFWVPAGTLNGMSTFENGKGYFVKAK